MNSKHDNETTTPHTGTWSWCDLCCLLGALAIVVGLFAAWSPLGWIAAGVWAVILGIALDGARREADRKGP